MIRVRVGNALMTRLAVVCLFLFLAGFARATTWDEPWHEEVMSQADSFVKVRITEVQNASCKAEVLKVLGGMQLSGQIELAGYSSLKVMSTSSGSHETGLPFRAGGFYYLFVKKDARTGKFQIPTPTSGWAGFQQNNVAATYRHSYHKALVPEEIYEKTMQAIFSGVKGLPYDTVYMTSFLKQQLSMSVASLAGNDPETHKRFFLQHVALEAFYYLRKGAELSLLVPFVNSEDFHVQVSACRAVSAIDSAGSKELVMKFIEGKGNGFAKVMCVWGLKRLKAKEMIPRLQTYLQSAEDQETGFGGSIMDPRVATFFPDSVKASIKSLLGDWGKSTS